MRLQERECTTASISSLYFARRILPLLDRGQDPGKVPGGKRRLFWLCGYEATDRGLFPPRPLKEAIQIFPPGVCTRGAFETLCEAGPQGEQQRQRQGDEIDESTAICLAERRSDDRTKREAVHVQGERQQRFGRRNLKAFCDLWIAWRVD